MNEQAPNDYELIGILQVLADFQRRYGVDVFIPSCPPRPEALLHAFMELQRKIDANQGNWEDRNIGSQMYPLNYSEACAC